MIDLFDREFVEPQEALGMKVIGQFRDLERPDRFVWLRGFSDMPSRKQMLADFYGGPEEEGEMGSGKGEMGSDLHFPHLPKKVIVEKGEMGSDLHFPHLPKKVIVDVAIV